VGSRARRLDLRQPIEVRPTENGCLNSSSANSAAWPPSRRASKGCRSLSAKARPPQQSRREPPARDLEPDDLYGPTGHRTLNRAGPTTRWCEALGHGAGGFYMAVRVPAQEFGFDKEPMAEAFSKTTNYLRPIKDSRPPTSFPPRHPVPVGAGAKSRNAIGPKACRGSPVGEPEQDASHKHDHHQHRLDFDAEVTQRRPRGAEGAEIGGEALARFPHR